MIRSDPMKRHRFVGRFLFLFIAVCGLLVVPWPGFYRNYERYFQKVCEVAFIGNGGRRILRFAEGHDARFPIAVEITLANRDQLDANGRGPVRILGLDARGIGLTPMALILALTLATPIPWRRRIWALFWGLLLVHVFILFSVGCYIWNQSTEIGLITLSPFWKAIAGGLEETLVTQLGASFVVPALVWIVVTFRFQDLNEMLGSCDFTSGQRSPVSSTTLNEQNNRRGDQGP